MYGGQYATPQYGPNPYNQVQYGVPQYVQQPPPPPPQAAPTVITIGNNGNNDGSKSFCMTCSNNTPTYSKKVLGAANFIWCLVGFFFVGPFSILAICMDGFNDVELRCTRCMGTKEVINNACN